MHESIVSRALGPIVLAFPILAAGCSGGAAAPSPTETSSSAVTAPSTATAPARGSAPDSSWFAAVSLPAGATCNAHPVGVSGDPTRSGAVAADADGVIRLSPPPESWGSRVALDCDANGAAQTKVVDFDDGTTFTRHATAELASRPVSTLPALTGDLDAIAPANLARLGYPPRPDPAKHARWYDAWRAAVSKPMQGSSLVGAHALGSRLTGTGVGGCWGAPWTGFVQAPGGFPAFNTCEVNIPTNYYGSLFQSYDALTVVPSSNCSAGPCTTGLWVGIGGDTTVNGSSSFTSNLLQSGFVLLGTNFTALTWEFAPDAGFSWAPLPSYMAVGDLMLFGGSGNTQAMCAGSADLNATYGCYTWWDLTTGYYVYASEQQPSGHIWFPDTVEYVAELPGSSPGNANYGSWQVEGAATDFTGSTHDDPGSASGTDTFAPYQQWVYNQVLWASGNQTSAQDPIEFTYKAY